MVRSTLLVVTALTLLLLPGRGIAQPKHYALESLEGLGLHKGKKGLRLTVSDEARRRFESRLESMTPEARAQARLELLAWIEGLAFSNGVIELESAGAPAPGAGEGARGFVGIAFRLQQDKQTYDAFYLRPTNGRADDQERRNHSTQYVSLPEWPWFRLRKEAPSKYESYVDLVPGEWTKIRIEVRGSQARLYVHGNEQPALIVNDVKSGAHAKGAVALWLEPGTVAHFRNLTVDVAPDER